MRLRNAAEESKIRPVLGFKTKSSDFSWDFFYLFPSGIDFATEAWKHRNTISLPCLLSLLYIPFFLLKKLAADGRKLSLLVVRLPPTAGRLFNKKAENSTWFFLCFGASVAKLYFATEAKSSITQNKKAQNQPTFFLYFCASVAISFLPKAKYKNLFLLLCQ